MGPGQDADPTADGLEHKGLPVHTFPDQAAWEAWLERNGAHSPGVWLRLAKKGSSLLTATYTEAVESALCFGWIDGQVARGDEQSYLQRFTRRTAKSPWSQINREKVAVLQAAGRLREPGLAAIRAAQADGRWERAYPSPSAMTVPEDLQAALDADPELAAAYERLSSANRYAILYRLLDAKRPETRARRLERFLDMLRRGERIYG